MWQRKRYDSREEEEGRKICASQQAHILYCSIFSHINCLFLHREREREKDSSKFMSEVQFIFKLLPIGVIITEKKQSKGH